MITSYSHHYLAGDESCYEGCTGRLNDGDATLLFHHRNLLVDGLTPDGQLNATLINSLDYQGELCMCLHAVNLR